MKTLPSPLFPARLRLTLLAGLSCVLLGACHHDDATPQPSTTYGTPTPVGSGLARAYVTTDASGNPTEVGVRLSAVALTGLPATPATGTMYMVALPTAANLTPFDHVSLDWNPLGHDPLPIYGVPHFDCHFYMQSMSAQMAITLDDPKGDIFPPTAMLPAGYQTAPNVVPARTVPMMGRHWVDPTSPEYQPGGHFSSTFIYGSYDGHVTFLEPMFTKDQLTPALSFTAPIKQPQTYEASVSGRYFPATYSLRYDAAANEYVIALQQLTRH
jgi:hypothetical protein